MTIILTTLDALKRILHFRQTGSLLFSEDPRKTTVFLTEKQYGISLLIFLLIFFGNGNFASSQDNADQSSSPVSSSEFYAVNLPAAASLKTNLSTPADPSDNNIPASSISSDQLADLQKSMNALQSELDAVKSDLDKSAKEKKKITCKLGGYLEIDALTADQSEKNRELYKNVPKQYQVRDVRLSAMGQVAKNVGYECTIAFNKNIQFKNVLFTMNDLPWLGDTKVGYFKVETGIGHLENFYNNTFADFDTNTYSFRVGRRLGLGSVHYFNDKNIRWFNGIFIGQDFSFSDTKELGAVSSDTPGVILNTRLSGAPIYCESADGHLCEVLHLGGSFMWSDPSNGNKNQTKLRCRPNGWSNDMAYQMNGTLNLDTGTYSVTEFEAAWQKKELGIVSEFFIGDYSGYDNAYGVSLTTRYFLTPGAYQTYNKTNGVFGGAYIPENCELIDLGDQKCFKGLGAWEVAGQWSWTDMNNLKECSGENTIYGELSSFYGELSSFTTALNWYWNSNARLGLNYVYSDINSAKYGSDTTENSSNNTFIVQMRMKF